jgi:hypothetical protein
VKGFGSFTGLEEVIWYVLGFVKTPLFPHVSAIQVNQGERDAGTVGENSEMTYFHLFSSKSL